MSSTWEASRARFEIVENSSGSAAQFKRRSHDHSSFIAPYDAVPMVTVAPLQVLPAESIALDSPVEYIFELLASSDLPEVDLSHTLAKKILTRRWHRAVVIFVGQYFHLLAWGFRLGIVCFGGLLYFDTGVVHDILKTILLPSTQSLVATVLFQSIDVLRLLGRSYEFWFMTTVNALNWISFAVILGDSRVLMSILGWFGSQTVILSDSSYRTTQSTVKSIIFSIPFLLALLVFVALKAIQRANFFTMNLNHVRLYNAVDIMSFTAMTLTIMLAKMVALKTRHVLPPSGGSGFLNVPCVLIRTNLRLVPLSAAAKLEHTSTRMAKSVTVVRPSTGTGGTPTTEITGKPFIQRIKLSRLPTPRIDARRTVLPFRCWLTIPPWLSGHEHSVRIGFYAFAIGGYALLLWETGRVFHVQVITSQTVTGTCVITGTFTDALMTKSDDVCAIVALVISSVTCGSFALFFQRDLIWLLFTNFDFVFSNVQVFIFCCCLLDMACWQSNFVLVVAAWLVWFHWALSIDALSPLAKKTIFRFRKQSAAFVLACVQLVGLGTAYIVLTLSDNGFRNRTIAEITLASRAFRLTTKSVLIGRIATIALWCMRQVFVLYTRGDDELNFIRGLVEYETPYAMFPRKHNKHTPAIDDEVAIHDEDP